MSNDEPKESSDKYNSAENVDSIIKNIESLAKDEPDAKSVNDAIVALSNKREDPENDAKSPEADEDDLSLSDFTDSEGSGDEKKKKANGAPTANKPGNDNEDKVENDEEDEEDEEEEDEKADKNKKRSLKDSLMNFSFFVDKLPKSLRNKSFKEDKTATDDEEIGVTAIGIKSDSGDRERSSPKVIAVTKTTNPITTTAEVAVAPSPGPKTRTTAAAQRNKERNENVATDSPLQSKKSWVSTLKKIPSAAKFGTIRGAIDTIKDDLLVEKDYDGFVTTFFKTDKKKN